MLRILIAVSFILSVAGCGSSCPPAVGAPMAPDTHAPAAVPDPALAASDPVPAEVEFPADWLGRWYGTVESGGRGAIAPFDMELHIEPIDGSGDYTWTIVYVLPDGRQERMYELVTVDAEAGHYRVDEKNSIIIDAYLVGGTMHTQFSVGQALITIRYIREGDTIVFDLMSNQLDPAIESGGEDGIPVVSAYPLTAVQRAILTRR